MKVDLGRQSGSSKLTIRVDTYTDSQLVLTVGDQTDMSVREIFLVEQHAADNNSRVKDLSEAIAGFEKQSTEPASAPVVAEAKGIAETANRILSERKWYSVSAEGLIEAAKAVGDTASTLVSTAVSVIEMLNKLKV